MNRIPLTIIDPAADARAAKQEADEKKRQRRLAATAARRAEDDAFGKLRYYRFQVIQARAEAHGLAIGNYLGPSVLTFVPLERWLGKANERAVLEHYLHVLPEPYLAAALANPFVVEEVSAEELQRNTPIRLRFEEASVYGTIGECLNAAKSKSWGKFVSIDPIEPNMPYGGDRIQFLFHKESRYNRRVEQRKYMKKRLGKGYRKIVGMAMGESKARFLKALAEDAAKKIAAVFDLGPDEFWRAVNGKTTITRPVLLEQGTLFED